MQFYNAEPRTRIDGLREALKISIKETAEKLRTLSSFLYTHTATTTTTREMAGPWPIAERGCEREVWRKELGFVV